ncbi:hypothetical protein PAPHI01_1008 [Pancytospora philotis]|nr:hypothetical protein PAPHI01_1008 [Pancytospora philotis]
MGEEKKKDSKFRIKWWWGSDEEEAAKKAQEAAGDDNAHRPGDAHNGDTRNNNAGGGSGDAAARGHGETDHNKDGNAAQSHNRADMTNRAGENGNRGNRNPGNDGAAQDRSKETGGGKSAARDDHSGWFGGNRDAGRDGNANANSNSAKDGHSRGVGSNEPRQNAGHGDQRGAGTERAAHEKDNANKGWFNWGEKDAEHGKDGSKPAGQGGAADNYGNGKQQTSAAAAGKGHPADGPEKKDGDGRWFNWGGKDAEHGNDSAKPGAHGNATKDHADSKHQPSAGRGNPADNPEKKDGDGKWFSRGGKDVEQGKDGGKPGASGNAPNDHANSKHQAPGERGNPADDPEKKNGNGKWFNWGGKDGGAKDGTGKDAKDGGAKDSTGKDAKDGGVKDGIGRNTKNSAGRDMKDGTSKDTKNSAGRDIKDGTSKDMKDGTSKDIKNGTGRDAKERAFQNERQNTSAKTGAGRIADTSDRRIDEEKQNSNYFLLILCLGIANVVAIVVLFLCTEFFYDASALYYKLPLFFLPLALIPFLCLPMPTKTVAAVLAMVSTVLTAVILYAIFSNRTRVLFFVVELGEDSGSFEAVEATPPAGRNEALFETDTFKALKLRDKLMVQSKPAVRIFLLAHELSEPEGSKEYKKTLGERYIKHYLAMRKDNGRVFMPAILTLNWGLEDAQSALQRIGETRYSSFGQDYVLFYGVFNIDDKLRDSLKRPSVFVTDEVVF